VATLAWAAISNRQYRIQYNDDLASTNWSDLPGDVTATNSVSSKADPTAPAARCYRVITLP
jgi:hypothetical protein